MTIWERRKITRKRKCDGCGTPFIPNRRNQKYCSPGSTCRMRKLRKPKQKSKEGKNHD